MRSPWYIRYGRDQSKSCGRGGRGIIWFTRHKSATPDAYCQAKHTQSPAPTPAHGAQDAALYHMRLPQAAPSRLRVAGRASRCRLLGSRRSDTHRTETDPQSGTETRGGRPCVRRSCPSPSPSRVRASATCGRASGGVARAWRTPLSTPMPRMIGCTRSARAACTSSRCSLDHLVHPHAASASASAAR